MSNNTVSEIVACAERIVLDHARGCSAPEQLAEQTGLYTDLGMNRASLAELRLALQDELGITIPDAAPFQWWETFGDVRAHLVDISLSFDDLGAGWYRFEIQIPEARLRLRLGESTGVADGEISTSRLQRTFPLGSLDVAFRSEIGEAFERVLCSHGLAPIPPPEPVSIEADGSGALLTVKTTVIETTAPPSS